MSSMQQFTKTNKLKVTSCLIDYSNNKKRWGKIVKREHQRSVATPLPDEYLMRFIAPSDLCAQQNPFTAAVYCNYV